MSFPGRPTHQDQFIIDQCFLPNVAICDPSQRLFPYPSAPPLSSYSPQLTYDRITQLNLKANASNPILRPFTQFYPRHDAEMLCRAVHELVPDIKTIVQILTRRTNIQRQDVIFLYGVMYNRDLITDLKSKLSGNFESLIVALLTPTFDFLAEEIRNAINGTITDEETVVEILCTSSNAEINHIKLTYYKLFEKNLEEDNVERISECFHRLLVSLSQGQRSEDVYRNEAFAKADAQHLLQTGEVQFNTLNMILRSRSYIHLQQIFLEYHRISGHNFEDVVRSEFRGDVQKTLRTIVKSIRDKSAFYAERLHQSIYGFHKNDRNLIRIVTTRSEKDMGDIKKAYCTMYGKSLEAAVSENTLGDFKLCLLGLIQCQS